MLNIPSYNNNGHCYYYYYYFSTDQIFLKMFYNKCVVPYTTVAVSSTWKTGTYQFIKWPRDKRRALIYIRNINNITKRYFNDTNTPLKNKLRRHSFRLPVVCGAATASCDLSDCVINHLKFITWANIGKYFTIGSGQYTRTEDEDVGDGASCFLERPWHINSGGGDIRRMFQGTF